MKQNPTSRKKGVRSADKKIAGREAGTLPAGYGKLLDELETRVRAAQLRAAVAANRELIQLYWDIGRMIVERQQREGWGQGVVERLAKDVQGAFPGLRGFSRTNVFRMRAFYLAYQSHAGILSQAVTELKGRKNSAQPVPKFQGKKVPQLVGQLPPKKVAQAVRQLAPQKSHISRDNWRRRKSHKLPDHLRGSLPTIEQIEAELAPKAKPKAKRKQMKR